MSETKPEHFIWADVVRIIAISLVVLVHTFIIPTDGSEAAFFSLVLVVIAKTAVPLFLMLSGALLIPKQESDQVFFQKRVKRIALPWITWTVVIFLVTDFQSLPSPLTTLKDLKHIFWSQFTFIPVLFGLYLLIPSLRTLVRYSSRLHLWYVVGLWFLGTSLLPYTRNTLAFPLQVDNGLVTQVVRYIGYILLGVLLLPIKLTKSGVLLTLAILGSCVMGTVWLMMGRESILWDYGAYSAPMIVVSSMALFALFVHLSDLLKKIPPELAKVIKIISQASFGVFLVHNLIIQIVSGLQISPPASSLAYNLSRWILVTLISFGVILVLSRIKGVQKFIT